MGWRGCLGNLLAPVFVFKEINSDSDSVPSAPDAGHGIYPFFSAMQPQTVYAGKTVITGLHYPKHIVPKLNARLVSAIQTRSNILFLVCLRFINFARSFDFLPHVHGNIYLLHDAPSTFCCTYFFPMSSQPQTIVM